MNYEKIAAAIKSLRLKNNMTQKNLAEKLSVTEQAVSKWERGIGLPDIETVGALAEILGVNVEVILTGDLSENDEVKNNMKNLNFYVCKNCGNVIVSTGEANISCCGTKLTKAEIVKAADGEKMKVEKIEDEKYITTNHPMTKDDYISFTALLSGERVEVLRHFPEWNLEIRIPDRYHGKFIWYSKKDGFKYQLI